MDQSNRTYDILIIGGGAVGCAVARELSCSQRSVALVEKEADVAAGTSGRNSAVVHAGFNNRPGSLMAQLCVEGNQGFAALCRQLEVPYRKTGKLLVAFDQEDLAVLRRLLAQGEANGCRGLHLLDQAQLGRSSPRWGGIRAMVSPETGIFDPFLYTVALAENAVANGVHFFFRHPVTAIAPGSQGGYVVTGGGERPSRPGWWSTPPGCSVTGSPPWRGWRGIASIPAGGSISSWTRLQGTCCPCLSTPPPRRGRGDWGPSDPHHPREPSHRPQRRVYPKPRGHGLHPAGDGPALSPGPAAAARPGERADHRGLRRSAAQAGPAGGGGYRDFVIREDKPGFVNLVGIESPGLTASLPIARRVAALVGGSLDLSPRADFQAHRRGIRRFRDQSPAAQAALIAADPDYGEVVCRCQTVTRAELRQAVENPLGVRTLAGIKYRAWATTGRCQGATACPKLPRCWWRTTAWRRKM